MNSQTYEIEDSHWHVLARIERQQAEDGNIFIGRDHLADYR